MHYIDRGEGDPVLMLHGNPTWSYYYRNLIAELEKTHRCIAPDHIGCGFSDKPSDSAYEYTLRQRVDDLEHLLDHLGISENITLVVHDWGGMIGSVFAARHPEKIRKTVILNTAGFPLPAAKKFPLGLKLCRTPFLGALLVRGFNAFCRGAAAVGTKRNPMDRGTKRMYISPYSSWKNRIAVHRFVQDIPLRPGDKAYDLVEKTGEKISFLRDRPVLICWGMLDFVFDRHFLDVWTEKLPSAEIHRFDDCGHYILEDAADEVIPLIRTFIDTK